METMELCSCLKPQTYHFYNGHRSAMFFAYQFHNSQKSYQGKDVSCLGTTESHLECNALLLQLSCYQTRFKSISWKSPIASRIVAEADGLITGSWLRTVHWDGGQLNSTYTRRISLLFTPRPWLRLGLAQEKLPIYTVSDNALSGTIQASVPVYLRYPWYTRGGSPFTYALGPIQTVLYERYR